MCPLERCESCSEVGVLESDGGDMRDMEGDRNCMGSDDGGEGGIDERRGEDGPETSEPAA